MNHSLPIVLLSTDAAVTEQEQQLAEFLASSVISSLELTHSNCLFYLQLTPKGLVLCDLEVGGGKPTMVDFSSDALELRASDSLVKQNLIKALGLKKNPRTTVLDAMAGLGKDAYLMAMAGCTVQMVEKSKIVFVLLRDGLDRLHQYGIDELEKSSMSLLFADFLEISPKKQKFDVVYLDPMYQSPKRKSKAKRDIERLQRLLGKEDNEVSLLEHGLELAERRVVVKRPKNAPPFANRKPDIVYKGSSARFDVYLTT
ncbi:MAG: 16S rRNA (guanine1516-N2)-methyltransferase [Pseudohongiellaceae bacterium]